MINVLIKLMTNVLVNSKAKAASDTGIPVSDDLEKIMGWKYSHTTRTLTVFGNKMTHIFDNVLESEIDHLIVDAKFKEALWRA